MTQRDVNNPGTKPEPVSAQGDAQVVKQLEQLQRQVAEITATAEDLDKRVERLEKQDEQEEGTRKRTR